MGRSALNATPAVNRRALPLAVAFCLAALPSAGRAGGAPDGAPGDEPVRVDEVEIRGLWLTEPSVVERELPFRSGGEVDRRSWELGLARLWNTGIFSRVQARLELRGERRVAVLELEDRFTPTGIFNFSIGGGTAWLRAGLNDINLAGRYLEAGAVYERFGRFNGGEVWARDPRLFGLRLDGLVRAGLLFRPRPDFALRRGGLVLEASGEANDQLRVGGRVEGVLDSFQPAGQLPAPPKARSLRAGPLLRVGRVDADRLRQRGASLEVRPVAALTTDPSHPRWGQLSAEALVFAAPGERWGLALRVLGGISGEAPAQDRFWLGGLDRVRGFPDSAVRTGLYLAFNAEARLTAFDSTWFAVVPAAFLDGAAARPDLAGQRATMLSAGGGVRLLAPRLVRTGVRVDVAVPLEGGWRPSLSLGVHQFF